MKYLREEVGTNYNACVVGKIVKIRTKLAENKMVRMKDGRLLKTNKEIGRLHNTRKTTSNMGWVYVQGRCMKGRGGRKVRRKGQEQGDMEKNNISSYTAKWLITGLTPTTGKRVEERELCTMWWVFSQRSCLMSFSDRVPYFNRCFLFCPSNKVYFKGEQWLKEQYVPMLYLSVIMYAP